jgi:hypothetical protein
MYQGGSPLGAQIALKWVPLRRLAPEETGILENPNLTSACYPALNQVKGLRHGLRHWARRGESTQSFAGEQGVQIYGMRRACRIPWLATVGVVTCGPIRRQAA